ncbi:tumor protein D54-like isoform X6 [Astyanax mexicanus]|uniref:Tumor protein D54-like isoform X6 n=1 Tax=Astyanax mexicanus TaxID=7994 RepID=A0A8T2LLC8_ASTMX|nr:tumor protein D54-like isoform X6 [Astyanax mexicanus]
MDPSQRDFTMDGASGGTLPPGLSEEEALEMQIELTKVEDEIQTLRQVLTAKERHAGELRRRLGVSPLAEFKNNISKGWQEVQSSNAYKKTQETLSQAGQMTSSALSTMGSAIRNRFGEMRALTYTNTPGNNYSMRHSLSMPAMRNSNTFKSFEDKMSKVVGGGSNGEGPQGPPGSNSNF